MDAKPLSAAVEERRAAVWARIRAADERRDLRDETELESLRSEVLDVLKSRR
jgi:predicted site-specific integrase-resolvase